MDKAVAELTKKEGEVTQTAGFRKERGSGSSGAGERTDTPISGGEETQRQADSQTPPTDHRGDGTLFAANAAGITGRPCATDRAPWTQTSRLTGELTQSRPNT